MGGKLDLQALFGKLSEGEGGIRAKCRAVFFCLKSKKPCACQFHAFAFVFLNVSMREISVSKFWNSHLDFLKGPRFPEPQDVYPDEKYAFSEVKFLILFHCALTLRAVARRVLRTIPILRLNMIFAWSRKLHPTERRCSLLISLFFRVKLREDAWFSL